MPRSRGHALVRPASHRAQGIQRGKSKRCACVQLLNAGSSRPHDAGSLAGPSILAARILSARLPVEDSTNCSLILSSALARAPFYFSLSLPHLRAVRAMQSRSEFLRGRRERGKVRVTSGYQNARDQSCLLQRVARRGLVEAEPLGGKLQGGIEVFRSAGPGTRCGRTLRGGRPVVHFLHGY